MKRKIGYARVSKEDQDLKLQIDELKAAGCERIFTDKASGAKVERNGLIECLRALEKEDALIVWRLDRLGRSLTHLVGIVEDLRSRGIGFRSLRDGHIDTTTASGELVFNIFATLAQFERRLIQERTRAGLSAARARGRRGGRKPVTADNPQVRAARQMHDGNMSIREICSSLKISKTTLYRYLDMTGG